jgi:signal peptidase II
VIGAIAAIVAVDQLTKAWAVAALSDGPVHVIGDTVEFELTRNGGGAFSRFQGMTPVLAVGAIVVTFVLFRVLRGMTDSVLVIALTLVLGGALGNLVDRLFRSPGPLRGEVVDWIQLPHWPIFNLADSAIVVGGCIAVLLSTRGVSLDGASQEQETS